MVAIGEESGALDDMLAKVADFYEEEVDNAVDALSSLLEPLIMVIIGTLVGGLVIAMYLPIFKMAAVVSEPLGHAESPTIAMPMAPYLFPRWLLGLVVGSFLNVVRTASSSSVS